MVKNPWESPTPLGEVFVPLPSRGEPDRGDPAPIGQRPESALSLTHPRCCHHPGRRGVPRHSLGPDLTHAEMLMGQAQRQGHRLGGDPPAAAPAMHAEAELDGHVLRITLGHGHELHVPEEQTRPCIVDRQVGDEGVERGVRDVFARELDDIVEREIPIAVVLSGPVVVVRRNQVVEVGLGERTEIDPGAVEQMMPSSGATRPAFEPRIDRHRRCIGPKRGFLDPI